MDLFALNPLPQPHKLYNKKVQLMMLLNTKLKTREISEKLSTISISRTSPLHGQKQI